MDEFTFGNKLHPLNQNVDVPSLEEDVVPLRLLDHVENEANIELLILRRLVVLLDLAKHADDRQQGVFLELRLQFKVASEVRLQQSVLDERESCCVEFLDQFVDELEGQKTEGHLSVHVVLEHQIVVVFLFDEALRLFFPLFNVLER